MIKNIDLDTHNFNIENSGFSRPNLKDLGKKLDQSHIDYGDGSFGTFIDDAFEFRKA